MLLLKLAQTRRPRRAGEWTEAKAVTFIVTLAASRSVTLAATRAGMSRKAAYVLKHRDRGFEAAWRAAVAPFEGNKVCEVNGTLNRQVQGNGQRARSNRAADARSRDRFFANLWNWPAESGWQALARTVTLP
jgi:hypothetical protein